MRRILKTLKLLLTFWGAGACLLLSSGLLLCRAPVALARPFTRWAGELILSANAQAEELYGRGVKM